MKIYPMTCCRPLERYMSILQVLRYSTHIWVGTKAQDESTGVLSSKPSSNMRRCADPGWSVVPFWKMEPTQPPPPISGTKTSRKLLILKLFPTPFKLMGSRNHRLMFAQFYMSFYHKNPKMNSWNPNSWRFCFRWFSFSGPFFRFHAVHVPCLQPAPPFAHLDDLSDMLWWPQRCPGGFQVPGLPVVFFNKNKHLQKQINYILDLPEKKSKICLPFFLV